MNKKINNSTKIEDLAPLCRRLRLSGLYEQLECYSQDPSTLEMSHLEWLNGLLAAEIDRREGNALRRRLSEANIRHPDACMTNIDFTTPAVSIKPDLWNSAAATGYGIIRTASSRA